VAQGAAGPLIVLEEAVVRYGRHRALGPVSLAVERGELVGVVGPNGAGKSTLLAALAGSVPLSSGRRSAFLPPRRLAATLLQHHRYVPDLPLTASDVVRFGRIPHRRLGGRLGRVDRAAVDDALAALDLAPLAERPYRALSGGQQRKVQLARLLAQDAPLLLLDEPSAGLDLEWRERLVALVARLHDRHDRAVVLVTHDVDQLPASCTRVLLLEDGLLRADGPPASVLRGEVLSALYGCPIELVDRAGRWHALASPPADARGAVPR
jgi:iron complex transport system ATP-binding protein